MDIWVNLLPHLCRLSGLQNEEPVSTGLNAVGVTSTFVKRRNEHHSHDVAEDVQAPAQGSTSLYPR